MKQNILAIAVLILLTVGLGYMLAGGGRVNDDKQPEKINLFSEEGAQGHNNEGQMTPPVDENLTNNKPPVNGENKKIMKATMVTSMGTIVLELNPNTPKTTENFVKLAREGFYNGTKFHRIIAGFMNQGGDPLSKDDTKMDQWGTGGPGYKFEDEITASNKNDIWTISMANAGPNTNGSQFFINAAANNFLDSKHTVFGKVISGVDVAEAMNNVETDSSDRPLQPVVIENIFIQ